MSACTESAAVAPLAQGPAHEVASLAHGLAHEVAALTDAKGKFPLWPSVRETLDRMIDDRKARIESLGAQVAGHA